MLQVGEIHGRALQPPALCSKFSASWEALVRVKMAMHLAATNGMSSVDHLSAIYAYLSSVLLFEVPGAIVEVGCNRGQTSVWLQQIIQDVAPHRELHVFDSFQGMPPAGSQDPFLKEGELKVSVADVEETFTQWDLPLPQIHEGWFEDTLPAACPDKICFAYLDGDFYESIKTSLEVVVPRLSPGGVMLIDDYPALNENPLSWAGLPGVRLACDEYFQESSDRPEVLVGLGGMAVALFRKPLSA
ncbi:TylF/MycF/NovP-related O-methyltransferase [Dactylosporangium matsuzakiense]|nr:TylF/MycF/NovP-related O-methyltransferase [Dactylosporangium matsuzakiense]